MYYTINSWSHLSCTHCVLESVLQLATNMLLFSTFLSSRYVYSWLVPALRVLVEESVHSGLSYTLNVSVYIYHNYSFSDMRHNYR